MTNVTATSSPTKSSAKQNLGGLAILGGGPAGLATGYYAKKIGLPLTIFEAGTEVGGNARTLRHGDFLFDTGAHRFHDKFADVTEEIKTLLGEELVKIDVPSQIVDGKKFIDFPLSPLDLAAKLGVGTTLKASLSFAAAKFSKPAANGSFEEIAVYKYGRTIAKKFLLDYSEKLWGAEASKLSPAISGLRLMGLDLKTFVIEALRGKISKTAHLDGAFYYPRQGIGRIMERLADYCGAENVQLESRVTKVFHDNQRIKEIEINGAERCGVNEVASSLPLSLLLNLLEPKPPQEILEMSQRIRFQNILLVVLFINRKQITPNASLYFPDARVPFTRVYEPKNRSGLMSPTDKTSLCIEIPCGAESSFWKAENYSLVPLAVNHLEAAGLIRADEVFEAAVHRIPFAYPILELGFEDIIGVIQYYLSRFENLKTSGRNGKFAYTHIHDMMRQGQEIAEEIKLKTQNSKLKN